MVFHSFQFILVALPICYVAFLLAFRAGGWNAAFSLLAVASIAFYAQWSVKLAAILMASVVCNYVWCRVMLAVNDRRSLARTLLIIGICANLFALGYLRYANFLIDIINSFVEQDVLHLSLLVPIGVSFYTFIQIGFLVETYAGQVKDPGFGRYMLFATFFPCVTAGPLVQQSEVLGQMEGRKDHAFNPATLAAGLAMFGMGLFKKVVFADQIAPFADAIFAGAVAGQAMSGVTAWLGAVCYALQLYFDFSGYSDMAIGLGLIFGIKLPLNFNSPFKTTNISDFWRCWHMTMTRFFTTYIYTTLAVRGMRSIQTTGASAMTRYIKSAAIPAVATFMIAGIWHGAGWTFVVYGLIHGLAISVYLGWSRLGYRPLPAFAGWLLTMSVVISALVVFRAPDLTAAGHILLTMWSFGKLSIAAPGQQVLTIDAATATAAVVVLGAVVLLMPNTQQIMHRYWPSSDEVAPEAQREAGLLKWSPGIPTAVVMGLAFCIALGSIGSGTTFLYYQF